MWLVVGLRCTHAFMRDTYIHTHTHRERKRRMGEDIWMGPAQERKEMKHVRWGGPQLAVVAMADSRRT